jgi:hypothetical protein
MLHFGLDLCVSNKRIVVMYFFASLSFLVAGICLSSVIQQQTVSFQDGSGIWIGGPPPPPSHPYLDLGLRLYGFGIFLVAGTFYQSLVGERRTSQKSKITITKF